MLFQKNILKKYLAAVSKEETEQAWNKYQSYFLNPDIQANIMQSKEEQFQEGFLRELFVKVLGYTLNPSPDYNLITEQKNETNSKKADGAILVDGTVVGVIELKDHKTTDLSKIEQQAFGYKNQNQNAVYVIISNFEKLRFYIDNAVEHIEFDLFHLSEDDFSILWLCLAYKNIAANLPKLIKNESVSNEDTITNSLYKDYSLFKRMLFADIVEHNPTYDKLLLFKKTQKLLDRLLFIFFAEDGGLLPPNSMIQIIDQWEKLKEMDEYRPFYDRVKKYFGYMNTGFKGQKYEIFAYNGGLFKPDEVLDNILISDEVLLEHTKRLSTYDYESEVDVNILGHIFENSLSEIEEVTKQINGGEPSQTSKRKKDGVFYTPQYITKYIVENTVGKLCNEKKKELQIVEDEYFADKNRQIATKKVLKEKLDSYREWLLGVSICDPACGSGAFLNAALSFLMAEHRLIDEMEAKLTGSAIVFQNVENSILENNLYGVDINEESVEIAKLSLWLRTAKPHRKLTSLNNNIKCGNSLISDPAVAGDKAFDWQKEFPEVFRKKRKKAWHITTATHDSRTSQRMIDYKVRLLRDHGMRPYANPVWLDPMEERIVTETVAEIVKSDRLNVLAYNVCGDHMHLVLVCEEEEVPKIVGKIKSMTARAVNIAMGRTVPRSGGIERGVGTAGIVGTAGHAPLSEGDVGAVPEVVGATRGETQCSLWTRKYGCVELDSDEYLYNAIAYVKNNRKKHGLPPLESSVPAVPTVSIGEAFRPEYDGGFDVVIGNPPYVQLQSMGAMSDVYAQCGYESYNKSGDLYCLFTERGYNLLKQNGLQSFIMPNKWMLVEYGKELRRFLAKTSLQQILNFGDIQFFKDATIYVCIFVVEKSIHKGDVAALSLNQKTYHGDFMTEIPAALREFDSDTFGEEPWIIRPAAHTAILNKMQRGVPLKELPLAINYGIKTGYNDAFFIDGETRRRLIAEDPKSAELIKPLLRGRDIQAWVPINLDLFLINTHNGIKCFGVKPVNVDDYPAIKSHLNHFYKKLEKRQDKGITPFNLRNCEYLGEFSRPKIMYPNMTSLFPFIYDERGFFGNDKTFMITALDNSFDLKALTTIFNSKLCKLWIWYNCPELLGGTREIRKVYFENFPVPTLDNCARVALNQFADRMLDLHHILQEKKSRFLHRVQDNLNVQKISAAMENFEELDFKAFTAELKKQKIKLTLTQQDEWEEYFNNYKAECISIKNNIDATDREIDNMVYALYGLTEEEIKVVEGK